MNVFFLGAGRPARGEKPAALKNIALNTKAIDWQIHSFESACISVLNATPHFHYLGGYHVAEVIKNYQQLNFTVIPDWKDRSVLHTLLSGPFCDKPTIVSYSDTIFRSEVIQKCLQIEGDIVFGIDSQWRERYESRSYEDISNAEVILIDKKEVEFTGLVYFSKKVSRYLSSLDFSEEIKIGKSLPELIFFLKNKNFHTQFFDVSKDWAEFNSSKDIASFILGTKAETLARLKPLVKYSHIGKQISFTLLDWKENSENIIFRIADYFKDQNIIIRSSSKREDHWNDSNAGEFKSLLNIDCKNYNKTAEAIEEVITSYKRDGNKDDLYDQVLIQPFIKDVRLAGVVFTCGLETGAPYYYFNFDDKNSSTDSVTAGSHGDLRTVIVNRWEIDNSEILNSIEPSLVPVLKAVVELEKLLGFDKLDIEFAVDFTNQVHIFQVRPITVDHSVYEADKSDILNFFQDGVHRFKAQQNLSPFVCGKKTLLGNMPDWNPAEIIGKYPKPLAFSLYRYLITNEVWALQRAEFGFKDVRPHPLIVSVAGQPYVDVRASLNSFIPCDLPENLTDKLADAYIDILADNSHYHDKIEFEIAFTIWTPCFKKNALERLKPYSISLDEIDILEKSLKRITCNAFLRLASDIKSIDDLTKRRKLIMTSQLTDLDKFYALIDDCRHYGTLAFAHAARAGFIATTFLKSLVLIGVFSEEERLLFLRSCKTVLGEFHQDKYNFTQGKITLHELIERYGHLRSGTYQVEAQAYWENPEHYLLSGLDKIDSVDEEFAFTLTDNHKFKIDKILKEMGSELSVDSFFTYCCKSIQAREAVKFEFTKNLSIALDLCIKWGKENNFSRSDLSYLEYYDFELLKLNVICLDDLSIFIQQRKKNYTLTKLIELPSLILHEMDFYCFERMFSQPNFITMKNVESLIYVYEKKKNEDNIIFNDMHDKIILISQADPGFDWLFGHPIAGLITQYGGANSHMAIRAAEMNLPAAIGVGDKLYERVMTMKKVQLDCANQVIREML